MDVYHKASEKFTYLAIIVQELSAWNLPINVSPGCHFVHYNFQTSKTVQIFRTLGSGDNAPTHKTLGVATLK